VTEAPPSNQKPSNKNSAVWQATNLYAPDWQIDDFAPQLKTGLLFQS
jgi:hypothetical protein